MMESFDPVHGALPGLDQDLATSLSSLDVIASKLLRIHPETSPGDLNRQPAPSSFTCFAYPHHSPPTQKAI